MTTPLEYAHPRTGRVSAIEALPDGGVVVTVPTKRTGASVAWHWAGTVMTADIVGLVLGPLLFPLLWPICMVLVKDTPRAVLRITAETFTFTATTDQSLGRVLDHREWPQKSVLEIRPNRYDGGLYVRIAGQDALTLLSDLPAEVVAQVAAALAEAGARLAEKEACDGGTPTWARW